MNAPPRRPALRYMGWWMLPAAGLVLVSLAIVYPYTQRAGAGHDPLGATVLQSDLASCPLRAGMTPAETGMLIRLRLDPRCARRFGPLTLAALGRGGASLAETSLNGNPNDLVAHLDAPAQDTRTLRISAHERAAVDRLTDLTLP